MSKVAHIGMTVEAPQVLVVEKYAIAYAAVRMINEQGGKAHLQTRIDREHSIVITGRPHTDTPVQILKQATADYYSPGFDGFGPAKHRNHRYNDKRKNRSKNKAARKQRKQKRK